MKELILTGIVTGISISLSFGSVFFSLLQTNLRYGLIAGVTFSTGVFLSDILISLLLYFGLSYIFLFDQLMQFISVSGGTFLIFLGIRSIVKKPVAHYSETGILTSMQRYFQLFLKGFVINNINPGVWVFWVGVTGIAALYKYKGFENDWIILAVSATTIFAFDLIKTALSVSFRKKMTPDLLQNINLVAGVCLLFSGIFIILSQF